MAKGNEKNMNTDTQTLLLQGIRDDIQGLEGKVDALDKAIRGNGNKGLKQELSEVRRDFDAHVEAIEKEEKKNTLSYRWKGGSVVAILIALLPAITAFHQLIRSTKHDKKADTKAVVLEVLREVVVEKKATQPKNTP